jgi:hypothetical protein
MEVLVSLISSFSSSSIVIATSFRILIFSDPYDVTVGLDCGHLGIEHPSRVSKPLAPLFFTPLSSNTGIDTLLAASTTQYHDIGSTP